MTHSIISLGKGFALDPCKELVLPVGSVGASKGRWPFEVAAGDPHPSALLLQTSCPEWTACLEQCNESRKLFRLPHLGVMAVYPMQTVMRFSRCNRQNGNKKAATKQTSPAFAFSGRSC